MKEIIKRYKKAIDDEDWYTIEKIQKEISDKQQATSLKLQAPSGKLQATSLTGPELWDIIRYESK